MDTTRRRTITVQGIRLSAVLVTLVAAGALLAAPVVAQEDPYGSTTTTAGTEVEASCTLSAGSAEAGADVTATVSGVPIGETVRILFDGAEVGRATAEGDGQSSTAEVQIGFQVPDRPPGDYVVAAAGASFTAECSAGFGTGASVLGFTIDRGGSAGSGSQSSRSGVRGLASTGVAVTLLVAVAIALLLVGRALIEPDRRLAVEARRRSGRSTVE